MPGELGFDTGPFVSVAAFCDQVIEGKDGVLSLIRVVDQLNVQAEGPEPPNELPPLVATSTLVVILRAGKARGGQKVTISLEHPDGTKRAGGEAQVNFSPGEAGGVNLLIPIAIEVRSAGLYWTDVAVNGRLVTRVPLQITYGFIRGPSPADP